MKQVLLKGNQLLVGDVPQPALGEKDVLVKTHYSVISSGTERTAIQGSEKGLVSKVISNPELVWVGLQLIRERGLKKTWEAVQSPENPSSPLGYSLAGEVVSVGRHVSDINVGELVACAGAQCAHHAEVVSVPRNLLARIPPGVDPEDAAFTTLGSIAMQGLRRADLSFGETVVIIGLGLLGLLAVQIGKAACYRVVALDIDQGKVDLAQKLGADLALNNDREDIIKEVLSFTRGLGADAVIIYAATDSDKLVNQAFDICRQKGKVVGVGVFGMNLDRGKMYQKELDFLMSTSYGPGRYDRCYEEEGIDYPIGYVRWTENRNFEEFLHLIKQKQVQIKPLISAVFPLEQAVEAYRRLAEDKKSLGIVLKYGMDTLVKGNKHLIKNEPINAFSSSSQNPIVAQQIIRVAVVGAGDFVGQVHLPNLASLSNDYHIRSIITAHGYKAEDLARKYKADFSGTDYQSVLDDPDVDLIILGTRHNLHYPMIIQALEKKKPVFTEKPLCLTQEELLSIKEKVVATDLPVYVGFNRRHAPLAVRLKEHLDSLPRPYLIHYRVNAGFIPPQHWTQDPVVGGGRLVGEACHFFDFFLFLVGQPVNNVQICSVPVDGRTVVAIDNFSVNLKFADGSLANLIYTSLGHSTMTKENVEVFAGGKSFVLNDFQNLDIYGININKQQIRLERQEKGWREELLQVSACLKGQKDCSEMLNQGFEAMDVTFRVADLIAGIV